MYREISRIVAVQKIEPHPAHLNLPSPQPEGVARQHDLQAQPFAVGPPKRCDRQLSRIVVGIERLLRSVRIDRLAKIALLIKQSHSHHGHTQIAGRLQLISRHIAQPPGINREGFAQHEFHAEVGHGSERRLRMVFLKPSGRFRQPFLRFDVVIHFAPKGGVGQTGVQFFR
jgi:hypothetical protein